MAIGTACAVHVHLSAVPLEDHHIQPTAHGGKNVKSNRVLLCANGHSMTHYLLDLYLKALKARSQDRNNQAVHTSGVPWSVQIRYGYKVRRLARQGAELSYRAGY
jgi:hypothetical protein